MCRLHKFLQLVGIRIPGVETYPAGERFIAFHDSQTNAFASDLDAAMVKQNIYYKDLIDGAILRPLVVRAAKPDAFRGYTKSQGKLGGKNTVTRLSNDRKITVALGSP